MPICLFSYPFEYKCTYRKRELNLFSFKFTFPFLENKKKFLLSTNYNIVFFLDLINQSNITIKIVIFDEDNNVLKVYLNKAFVVLFPLSIRGFIWTDVAAVISTDSIKYGMIMRMSHVIHITYHLTPINFKYSYFFTYETNLDLYQSAYDMQVILLVLLYKIIN